MLEGKAMREQYEEGSFDKKMMDDLHSLGEKMLEVIGQTEKSTRAYILFNLDLSVSTAL